MDQTRRIIVLNIPAHQISALCSVRVANIMDMIWILILEDNNVKKDMMLWYYQTKQIQDVTFCFDIKSSTLAVHSHVKWSDRLFASSHNRAIWK